MTEKELTQEELEQALNNSNTDLSLYDMDKRNKNDDELIAETNHKGETFFNLGPDGANEQWINLDTVDLTQFSNDDQDIIVEAMSKKQISAAFGREQQKSDAKPKVKTEPVVKFALTSIKKGTKISLAELIDLTDTPIKDAIQGMRPLDKANIQSLQSAYESGEKDRIDKIPPMILQGSTKGPIILAGYHRREAQRLAILSKYEKNPMMLNGDGILTQQAWNAYKEELKTFYVKYVTVNLPESEIPAYAAMDNLTNGLPPTEKGRSNLGLYLYRIKMEQYKDGRGPKPKWDDIVNIVGVSRQAMNQQRLRNEEATKPDKRAVKIDDAMLDDDVQKEMDELTNIADSKRQPDILERSTKAIINASIRLADEQISENDLREFIQGYVKDERTYKALILLSKLVYVNPPVLEVPAK